VVPPCVAPRLPKVALPPPPIEPKVGALLVVPVALAPNIPPPAGMAAGAPNPPAPAPGEPKAGADPKAGALPKPAAGFGDPPKEAAPPNAGGLPKPPAVATGVAADAGFAIPNP